MVFEIVGLVGRDQPAASRDAGFKRRVVAPGDEGMPLGEAPAFGEAAIGAGYRKPGKRPHELRAQRNTFRDVAGSLLVGATAAGFDVEQGTCNVGIVDFAGVGVLELLDATARATVADGLPLLHIHLFEGERLPKGFGHLGLHGAKCPPRPGEGRLVSVSIANAAEGVFPGHISR